MEKIKTFFKKIQLAFVFLFSNNYVFVGMIGKTIYATARTESVLDLDAINEVLELTMDDAESFYDYENQNQL